MLRTNETRIVISGVEGVNKGAELMLYAILREIEVRFPDAIVYLPISQFPFGLKKIQTSLQLRQSPNRFVRFLGKYHITGLIARLGWRSKYLYNLYPIKGAKYYIDASGLFFSDQMISSEIIAKDLNVLLNGYHNQGTKVIYLPQAFGPFYQLPSRNAVEVALKYSDLVCVRDDKSQEYLMSLGNIHRNIKKYYDFTGILQGTIPVVYQYLSGRVCLILNTQIIRKGIMGEEEYLDLFKRIIEVVYDNGHKAFILDHANDLELSKKCCSKVMSEIPIISGLDALDVKGIISQSYLCISSRFHGVVSAFSSCVPCLTTSWNHKYQELLNLYEMEDALLSASHMDSIYKVSQYLSKDINQNVREKLRLKKEVINHNIEEMWQHVWSI